LRIDQLMLQNESAWRNQKQTCEGLLKIWQAMKACVARGLREGGELPGGLHVQRRAPKLYQDLSQRKKPRRSMPWIG